MPKECKRQTIRATLLVSQYCVTNIVFSIFKARFFIASYISLFLLLKTFWLFLLNLLVSSLFTSILKIGSRWDLASVSTRHFLFICTVRAKSIAWSACCVHFWPLMLFDQLRTEFKALPVANMTRDDIFLIKVPFSTAIVKLTGWLTTYPPRSPLFFCRLFFFFRVCMLYFQKKSKKQVWY